jgi:phosphate starvation-inducible PhoH-like protein
MSKRSKKLKPEKELLAIKKDTTPRVHQNSKIDFELQIIERTDFTDKQKQLIELIEDKSTRVVFIQGPAGTSKSFTSIYAGLKLMNKKSVSDIVYVRSIAESASKSLGSLPGEANDKMEPFLMPLYDKLEELLPSNQLKQLIKEERIEGIPVNYLRGASINAKFVVIDEAQNLDYKELTTALTRIGKFSKFIILGDPLQSDIGKKSGFMDMFDLFNDDISRSQGIHCFSFTRDDIVRSGILKYIVERIESNPKHQVYSNNEPMFVK